ncbi:1-acyl-sn-glycerol-3-phosphate acyltransferase alpha [Galendromus occidentalis]|uniref:1-acyl-sn-glycerol-3-phosphate acyltransferase n=1 Tax=Galendromus occidentalis TaxID=34638 RepID=A0AAJ6VVC8_9ACAR|nr:1-acyl-sn-glycerol-3-phosphate acyltransferase alpha [Galendromus occidentalis]
MALYELIFGLSVLALAVTVSQRTRYWAKMVSYFIIMQLVSLVMLPMALMCPKDPRNFLYGARLINLSNIIFRIDWKLNGRDNVKDKAYIIVANHQSSIDVLGMMMAWDVFHPVVPTMKSALKYALPFGLYGYLSGSVFIDRGSERGRKALERGLEEAKKMKKSMWIFPEGTRNHTEEKLLPFKKGAFHMAVQAQIPILPVVFSDYSNFYDRDGQRFDSGKASVTVLPEISTEGLTSADVAELCEKTRNLMIEQYVKTAPTGRKCT